LEAYDERFARRPSDITWIGAPDQYYEYLHGRATFSPEEIEYIKGQYDAELLGLDDSLARLFEYLKASKLYDDTLVIVTSDHGEELLEHGFLGHGFSLYEPVLNVPLLIKTPQGTAQPTIASPSSMQFVDFLPTIAAVVEGPPLPKIQGTAWGAGRDYRLAEAYCRACPSSSGVQDIEGLLRDLAAIRLGPTKVVASTGKPELEAFDLRADPNEDVDVSTARSAEVERALQLLRDRAYYIPETNSEEDPETLRRLRSLGYVQ
jgi:arylsulfatase A-like enzyme